MLNGSINAGFFASGGSAGWDGQANLSNGPHTHSWQLNPINGRFDPDARVLPNQGTLSSMSLYVNGVSYGIPDLVSRTWGGRLYGPGAPGPNDPTGFVLGWEFKMSDGTVVRGIGGADL